MNKILLSLILASLVGGVVGHSAQKVEIDSNEATLAKYRAALPDKPLLAEYEFRLQRRIDEAYFEEHRAHHFSGGAAVGKGHEFMITLIVLADGRIGTDEKELAIKKKQEPELAAIALSAIASITEKPVPFSPALKKEVGSHFEYLARFYVR